MFVQVIRNDDDLTQALGEIEVLWNAESGTEDGDKLDALVTLVTAYEDRRYPIPRVSPLELLKYMMAENGRTQADLALLLGSRSRASEILSGKRDLTLDQIRKLHREWHIPAAALIGDMADA